MVRQFPQLQARAQLTGQCRCLIQVPELWTEQEPWLPEKPPWLQHHCPLSWAGITCQGRMLIMTEPLLRAGNDTKPLAGDKEQ